MLRQFLLILLIQSLGIFQLSAQTNQFAVNFLKQNVEVLPGDVINMPISIVNNSEFNSDLKLEIILPDQWKTILDNNSRSIKSNSKALVVFSLQASVSAAVGDYPIALKITDMKTGHHIGTYQTKIRVKELERISLLLVGSSDYVLAGEELKASYLLRNDGNTTKGIYLETFNCEIDGQKEVELEPGQVITVNALVATNVETNKTLRKYFTVKAVSASKVHENVYQAYTVFPSGNYGVDLYHRFPVKASAAYLYSNQYESPISGYQLELSGSGTIDTQGKHHLEFLARGPDNNRFGFMGLYNQYYVSYYNKNMDVTVGERTYQFTPLTEASRYGLGAETRFKLNNGLKFGTLVVKPRFYEEIENELATYIGYEFNKDNWFDLFYIAKETTFSPDRIHLTSLNGNITPFKQTNLEFEFSRGLYEGEWDNAYRANLVTSFSIFQFAGNYYNTGENYPGYYNNSKFYSANLSAKVTNWINVGVYAKEDFQNAQLDTFFISAPYSKSYHAYASFKLARQANLRLFWRDYERKDRLSKDKFHYETQSLNAQFRHRFKTFNYSVLGEYGETTNLQLGEVSNKQNTYRVLGNLAYRLNRSHSFQIFGSWSNVNSFISDTQRNLTFGLSANSRIGKNLNAMLYLQNAYDIDDYYQNRNLMQFSLDYSILKKHKISMQSYYTLFKTETENPNLTLSLAYSYSFGVPTAKAITAGSLKGTILKNDGTPANGVVLNLLNTSAITNEDGAFIFDVVPPGRHLLFVDNSGFEIDEILNIKTPLEVDVVGERETSLNMEITKGARLTGKFQLEESGINIGGIVVELKSEFDHFRISSKSNGEFVFPLVRPGNYTFKVYETSLPDGYITERNAFNFRLENGRNMDVEIQLKKKKRKIKFSSQNFVLTPNKLKTKENTDEVKARPEQNEKYYSVQIGGFSKKKSPESLFFKNRAFEIEIKHNNLYKYFIGKFADVKEAKKIKTELRKHYKGAFVVLINGNEITLIR